MKRRNLLNSLVYVTFMLLPTAMTGFVSVKKVNPAPGQSTWLSAAKFGQFSDEVTPNLLFQADVSGGVLTISTPGNYQVLEDLTCSVIIITSNVTLDLNGHKITCDASTTPIVTFPTGLSGVIVKNGYLINSGSLNGGSGIYAGPWCSKLSVQNLSIIGCSRGVFFDGSDTFEVVDSELVGLSIISSQTGMTLSYANANTVRDCHAMYSTQVGFELVNSQANCFYDCSALKTGGDTGGLTTTAGFKTTSGTSNMFQRCVTKQTKISSTTFGDKACGFLLTGSEIKTKLVDCVVNETDVISSPTAVTYGIHLSPTLAWSGYVSGFPLSNSWTIGSPKWSPDGKYVLTTHRDVGNGYGSNEYAWNGSTFTNIGGSQIGTSVTNAASDVSWSPDGKYYVIATYDAATFLGNTGLYAYSFDGVNDTALGSTLPSLATINLTMVRFSPNGKFIATVGFVNGTSRSYLSIWSFTPSASPALVDIGDKNQGALGSGQSVSWSPDGQYIASVFLNTVVVYSVSASGALSAAAVSSYTLTGAVSVSWSPCGKYIAAGDASGKVTLLTFDGTSTLTFVAQATGLSANYILGLTWSPDGQYIAVPGGDVASTNRVRILQYNGTTTLAVVATSPTNATRMASIAWSPDGKNIVTTDYNASAGGPVNVHMFTAMYGPSTCLISNCDICDTQATNFNMGRGVVSGGNNAFLSNISSNNGINYSYGIPNVYDGRFEILRSVLQPFDNVSMPALL